jgi:hypothetical protein
MRIQTPQGPNEAMWDSYYGLQMSAGHARVVAAFPPHMFVSGYAKDATTLAGSPVEAVDDVGKGSATVFGFEPNFRAFSDGSARLLRSAMLATPKGSVSTRAETGSSAVRSGTRALSLGHLPAQRRRYDDRGPH